MESEKGKKDSDGDKIKKTDDKVKEITEELENIKISSRKISSLKDVADYIKSDKCRNIIVLTGAGMSTPCGIPDFRSPVSGIYDNLVSYNLPYPEALFELDYFKKKPAAFYKFASKNLDCFKNAKPSLAHYFIKLLENSGKLRRVYSQNIDGLDLLAGINEKLVVECHGSLRTVVCLKCGENFETSYFYKDLKNDKIPHCSKCKGLVKPNMIFFGEELDEKFHNSLHTDIQKCDLLLVMGTSLKVQPVSSIVGMVNMNIPRILINLKCSGVFKLLKLTEKMKNDDILTSLRNSDFYHCSTCDEGCEKLAELLGWKENLVERFNSH